MKRTSWILEDRDYMKKCGCCDNYDIKLYDFVGMWMCEDCIVDDIESGDPYINGEDDDIFEMDSERIQAAYAKRNAKPIVNDVFTTLGEILQPYAAKRNLKYQR